MKTNGYELIFGDGRNDDVSLDRERRSVRIRRETIPLSPREYAVLETLLEQRGHVVPRSDLVLRVWGADDPYISACLNVYLHALRRKIEANPNQPRHIRTVRGRGVYFAA